MWRADNPCCRSRPLSTSRNTSRTGGCYERTEWQGRARHGRRGQEEHGSRHRGAVGQGRRRRGGRRQVRRAQEHLGRRRRLAGSRRGRRRDPGPRQEGHRHDLRRQPSRRRRRDGRLDPRGMWQDRHPRALRGRARPRAGADRRPRRVHLENARRHQPYRGLPGLQGRGQDHDPRSRGQEDRSRVVDGGRRPLSRRRRLLRVQARRPWSHEDLGPGTGALQDQRQRHQPGRFRHQLPRRQRGQAGDGPGPIRRGIAQGRPTGPSGQAGPPPIPLGRLGTPHDIADLVSFLVSDRANYITGEDINLSGGAS